MSPRTTVVIPVRNGARYLVQALVSVLEQIEDGDEILAVDDASTDETPELLADIADPRLRVLAGSGRGVSAARNLGLAQARGAFVAFLDHDDLWPAGRHRRLLAALSRDEGLDAAFGRVRIRIEPGAEVVADADLDGRHICELVGSALYRRRLLGRIEGFAEDMEVQEDADFHLRLVEAGMRSRLCPADALVYRRHGANATNDRARVQRGMFELMRRKLARARARGERV
jgi:glycosyltransferase involved in cell wall biosynthesis